MLMMIHFYQPGGMFNKGKVIMSAPSSAKWKSPATGSLSAVRVKPSSTSSPAISTPNLEFVVS